MKDRGDYLKKPVTNKKKTGQANFLQLTACLAFDLEDFDLEEEYLVFYTAIAMNLYMHNSSHIPVPGYGKAQERESDHPLYYFRSQTNHAHRIFFDAVTKTKDDARKRSLLPRNPAHQKLILEYMPDLKKLDERGFAKKGKKLKAYYGELLAASGVRSNNFNIYKKALEIVVEQKQVDEDEKRAPAEAIQTKLKKYLKPLPKKIKRLDAKTLQNRINSYIDHFKKLQDLTHVFEIENDLHKAMTEECYVKAKTICGRAKEINFDNLSLELTPGAGIIFVNFYPEFTGKVVGSRNYKEGVTNVIIGFFGGLLNHHAKRRGLFLHTDRRQSFGFVRPSITDLGSMRMRLSLGLTPAIYNEIVIDSLSDLDNILEKFDFRNRSDQFLKAYFKPCEKSQARGGKPTENTGNHFLKAMRSDRDKWQAIVDAQCYLDQAREEDENDYLTSSFTKFLKKFVLKQEVAALKSTKAAKVDEAKKKHVNSGATVLFSLLKNLVKYAVDYAASLEVFVKNDPILSFKHSYYHSLFKLFNNCDKAIALLNNLDKYEMTHVCAKSNLLIENILEYLISLDSLEQIRKNNQEDKPNPIKDLRATERHYAVAKLGLDEKQCAVFYADSGQQAITTSLLVLHMQFFATGPKKKRSDRLIYVCEGSYYELNSFLDKAGSLKTIDKESAKIVFTDITQLDQFEAKEFPALQALVIDVTHHPNLDNPLLNQYVKDLHQNNVYIFLASSSLKYEELFLDKYQSGKIISLLPKGQSLNEDVLDTLKSISNEAMHPAIASFLQMVNGVFRDKIPAPQAAPKLMRFSADALKKTGLFPMTAEKKKKIIAAEAKHYQP